MAMEQLLCAKDVARALNCANVVDFLHSRKSLFSKTTVLEVQFGRFLYQRALVDATIFTTSFEAGCGQFSESLDSEICLYPCKNLYTFRGVVPR